MNNRASSLISESPPKKTVVIEHCRPLHLVAFGYFRDCRHGFERRAFEIGHMQVVAIGYVDADNALVRNFPFAYLFLAHAAVVSLTLRLFCFVIFHVLLLFDDGLLFCPLDMRRHKSEFDLLPRIALFPFAAVARERYFISVIMQKNSKPISLPLPAKALSCLPESREQDAPIFALPSYTTIRKHLQKWAEDAGLDNHLHFHTSRHTFGTMMMTVGADLYTTCKLMGHADVRTTQIYAKIVDSKKIEAVDMVDKMFEQEEAKD